MWIKANNPNQIENWRSLKKKSIIFFSSFIEKRRLVSFFSIFLLITFLTNICTGQNRQYFSEIPLFENGKNGYACYRIPAIIKAPNGDLLAFAEGRVNGCSDFGNVDILLRKSSDNGISWSKQKIVADYGKLQAGNPAPVVDLLDSQYPNGRIFLFYNTGTADESATRNGKGLREILYSTSTDNGETWSKPSNITMEVHRPMHPPKYNFKEDWRTHANTPGHAIQLTRGDQKGRIFVPANHSQGAPQNGFKEYNAYAFYSDDHGKSWKIGEHINIPSANESIAVQLSDGRIMQNIRYQSGESKNRIVAISSNGGTNWDTTYIDKNLLDPICQASMIDYETPMGQRVLLFSNPHSQKNREKMTVRASFDNGQSWLLSREIRSGESAYSDLVIQEDQKIGLLYEHGNDGGIHYAHFNWNWLVNGKNNTDNKFVKKLISSDLAKGYEFKLAPPILEYDALLFENATNVMANLDYPNVRIHYTLNGGSPSENDPLFEKALTITQSSILKVKAFHDQCLPSETTKAKFTQVGKKLDIKKATFTYPANTNYSGGGGLSLFDHKKGTLNFHEKEWSGFGGDNCEITIELEKETEFSQVTLSHLSDTDSWIFPTSGVDVYISNDGKEFSKIYTANYPAPKGPTQKELLFLDHKFEMQRSKFIKIVVKNFGSIPEWHDGKGTPAWLFVDEILVK
ncbi:MAG: exo-alpha-sialidase [Saprospiraceae bacterium]|nr:exo-alpha-sialidase [Saprospiraceae bacterium]